MVLTNELAIAKVADEGIVTQSTFELVTRESPSPSNINYPAEESQVISPSRLIGGACHISRASGPKAGHRFCFVLGSQGFREEARVKRITSRVSAIRIGRIFPGLGDFPSISDPPTGRVAQSGRSSNRLSVKPRRNKQLGNGLPSRASRFGRCECTSSNLTYLNN